MLAALLRPDRWIAAILALAVALLLAVHAFETFGGYPPCELCLHQREAWWTAAGVAAVGLVAIRFQPRIGWAVCALLAIVCAVSTGLAAYHAGVEWKWWPGPTACTGRLAGPVSAKDVAALLSGAKSVHMVRCDEAAVRWFGVSMAGWNAVVSLLAALGSAAAVAAEAGFAVRVLSGAEEARYSALGVSAGQPDAAGVAGDLGGSSLELVRLGGEGPMDGVTLPLGPFAVAAAAARGFDPAAVRREALARLRPVAARLRTPEFHAVGGAWRNLALIHMRRTGYPLEVVHEYAAPAAALLETARAVARQPRAALERLEGVSRKRGETLPHAAVVLEAVVEALGVERVRVSAYGVREGLLLEAMTSAVRAADPLIAGCQSFGERQGMAAALGPALEAWLTPLWASLPPVFPPARGRALLAAACRLADVGARLHPDHRADLAFEQVLRAPVAGQTHPERAFLAAAVFARYTSAPPDRMGPILDRVLTPEQQSRARALGAALRLACDLCGRAPTLLACADLLPEPGRLVLAGRPGRDDLLLGEQTRKRLAVLAEGLGVKGEVRAC